MVAYIKKAYIIKAWILRYVESNLHNCINVITIIHNNNAIIDTFSINLYLNQANSTSLKL